MLGISGKKRKGVWFFFIEVKRPGVTSHYQEEDDFTKLMKQSKSSIDEQLHLGIEDPVSLGLLVEGMFQIYIHKHKD